MTKTNILLALTLLSPVGVCPAAPIFEQENLVSSVPGAAAVTDGNLQDPWGISLGPTGPFGVSNEATGTATFYDGDGEPVPVGAPLVLTIPNIVGDPGAPTGQVFNPTTDFVPPGGADPVTLIFAALDGTILSWNPADGTGAVRRVNSSGAVFTGLDIVNDGSMNVLYVVDSENASVQAFDGTFSPIIAGPAFTDPNLPSGFTPFNIRNLGGTLFVTYRAVQGTGGGIVNAFDPRGNLLRRITANSTGGALDDPWGLALAPASFGTFAGALLVGNQGDGRISAFDPQTGELMGQLVDSQGDPIANPGLRGLTVGNGGSGGDPDVLYFAAGDADGGLFGAIRAASMETSTTVTSSTTTSSSTTTTVTSTSATTATTSSTTTTLAFRCPESDVFWKNHPAIWPLAALKLGSQTYTRAELLAILKTPGTADVSLVLADRLIAAKLNIANGSDPAPAKSAIADANRLLAGFSGKLPYQVDPTSATGAAMKRDASILGQYDAGALTPSCVR